MSRPKSPQYLHRMSPRRHEGRGGRSQRFDSDPQRVQVDLERVPWNDIAGDRRERFSEDIHPEARRRPPLSPDHHRSGHPPNLRLKEYHRRNLSPSHELGYAQRSRLSPKHELDDVEREGRGRDGFREDYRRLEGRNQGSHSPQRIPRERLPSVALSHSHHPCDLKRDPNMGWRREDQIRGQGRSRERSPRERFQDHGRSQGRSRERSPRERFQDQGRSQGRDREGVKMHVPFEDRRREDLPREKSPHSDRYMRDSEFRERPRLLDRPLEGFEGGPGEHWGTQRGFVREPCPLIVEHDHGMMNSGGPPRRDPAEDQRNRGPGRYRGSDRNVGHGREDPGHRVGLSQERFRKSNVREEGRGHPVHDARRSPINHDPQRSPFRHDERRSPINHDGINPVYPERSSPMGVQLGRNGPMGHRVRGSQGHRGRSSLAQRGRGNLSRGGRMETGLSKNQSHSQTFPRGRSHSPQEHQRPGFRSRDQAWDVNPRDEESDWGQKPLKVQRLEPGRLRGAGRTPLEGRMGPGLSRERVFNPRWNPHKKVSDVARVLKAEAVEEETLTIKVDMNRPVGQNSKLCYSSDRQLSLDLVNVGRQRLDFLPMLEHSGTYRENSMHSGTFAQEIITLVHKVKEHYFRGDGVTLNERFSLPQTGGLCAEAKVEVEPERPTLNRRFNMNMNKMTPDIEPVFDVSQMQPAPRQRVVSDPGDLRHDLERRRQERLEGVKVTIPGSGLSQHPLGPSSELNEPEEELDLEEEDEGFSGWRGDAGQGNRWDGHMQSDHQRKGEPFRLNAGPQRRNNRLLHRNRPGPMRRQNHNVDGGNW